MAIRRLKVTALPKLKPVSSPAVPQGDVSSNLARALAMATEIVTPVGVMTVILTPALAEKWRPLIRNPRNLITRKVIEYARDIKNGSWTDTGDPIRFDQEGMIVDGNHRIEAVLLSGTPIITKVAYNLDDDALRNIDIGMKRSPGSILSTMGEDKSHANELAATLTLVSRWLKGGTAIAAQSFTPTISDRMQILADFPNVRKSVKYVLGGKILDENGKVIEKFVGLTNLKKFAGSRAVACFIHLFGEMTAPGKVDEFFKALNSGENLRKGMPAYALRELLIKRNKEGYAARRGSTRVGSGRYPQSYYLGVWLRAWNAHVRGEDLYLINSVDWADENSALDFAVPEDEKTPRRRSRKADQGVLDIGQSAPAS